MYRQFSSSFSTPRFLLTYLAVHSVSSLSSPCPLRRLCRFACVLYTGLLCCLFLEAAVFMLSSLWDPLVWRRLELEGDIASPIEVFFNEKT